MKLAFIKIDCIVESADAKTIEIPAGGIQFEMRNQVIILDEPMQLEVTHEGHFNNLVREVNFAVYTDQSLNAVKIMQESLFSIVAHEEVYRAIYKQMLQCKVVPMYRPLDVRELFNLEFENAYKQMLGV